MAGRRQRLVSPPEAEEVDHISHLPDVIIHHIFSFLSFKDVVKTSSLSKQWRLAWTSTPYIDLSLPPERPSISRALSRCTATEIEKFHLNAYDYANPCRWIHFVVARRVKDASFVFGCGYRAVPPQILCDCTSLVSLRVSSCTLSGDFTAHWPSLKKLCLRYVPLHNDKIIKILSGCPILESLTLRSLPDVRNLLIDSRSLRLLVIDTVHIWSLDISAPNLLSLRLLGGYSEIGFTLNGVSSLAEAELNFCDTARFCGYAYNQLKFLLEQLQHVAKITIGNWCLKVLSAVAERRKSYISSRWCNIIVYTTVCKCDLKGMAYLLQSSPLLERLVICNPKSDKFKFKKKDFPKLCDFDEKQFWRSQKEFYCVANHLKRVEICLALSSLFLS